MKHIIFVIGNYKNGGVAMRATNLANQFGANGYRVTLLSTKEIGKEIFFEQKENVELVSLKQFAEAHENEPEIRKDREKQAEQIKRYKRLRRFVRHISSLDRKLENQIKGLRRSRQLRDYLLLNQGAVLIPFGLACYEMSYYASRGLGCQLVYAEKNAAELECPSDPLERKAMFRILRQADGAVLQTQNEIDFYKGCLERNAVVIHNPIKNGLPRPYKGKRRPVVVNFCRISKQKNLPLLISAFRRLHEEYPEYSLEIYGNAVEPLEETQRDELVQSIAEKGETSYIHILPPAADVHQRVRDCAMFVSSSDFEGLSNSMIEAMAIGMPCVCTDCLGGGAREMITDGENGLLVPMQDEEALYLAMRRFVLKPELAEKCGRNAARITEEMNAKTIGEQWMDLLERL